MWAVLYLLDRHIATGPTESSKLPDWAVWASEGGGCLISWWFSTDTGAATSSGGTGIVVSWSSFGSFGVSSACSFDCVTAGGECATSTNLSFMFDRGVRCEESNKKKGDKRERERVWIMMMTMTMLVSVQLNNKTEKGKRTVLFALLFQFSRRHWKTRSLGSLSIFCPFSSK